MTRLIGFCAIGYESERNAIIEHCIIGGNANDESCGSAKEWHYCITDPFDACEEHFAPYYKQARENRMAFCRNADNVNNALCAIGGTFANVCKNHPFDALCRGNNIYRPARITACLGDPFAPRCAGETYNDLRASFCSANVENPSCLALEPTTPEPTNLELTTPQVTAAVWADSFDEDLENEVKLNDIKSRFLIGRATDLNNRGMRSYYDIDNPVTYESDNIRYNGNLTLANATFNKVALGGDAADGVAFFSTGRINNSNSYAGVLSGTNLGAPLTQTQGSAKWVGSFQSKGRLPIDFVLDISFGTGNGAGEIEAIIQKFSYFDFHIAGEFDDAGVITGTALRGGVPQQFSVQRYRQIKQVLSGKRARLARFLLIVILLIMISARLSRDHHQRQSWQLWNKPAPITRFMSIAISDMNPNAMRLLNTVLLVATRMIPSVAGSANARNYCVSTPFRTECRYNFTDYYKQARANRLAFCQTAENSDNHLCTVATTFSHICNNYPFNTLCIGAWLE